MATNQSELSAYSDSIRGVRSDDDHTEEPRLGFEAAPSTPVLSSAEADAREADWVIFTGRFPYVFDAARLGYGIGHREDSSYQWTPDEVDLPVHFLDNNYENADLNRFVERVFSYEPEVAVVGDIYDEDDLDEHLEAVNEVKSSYPDLNLLLVPKCESVLSKIPDHVVIGFPNGASDIHGLDLASYHEWRKLDNSLHILGGPPLATANVIRDLTSPTIDGLPPANIAGLDSNRIFYAAERHGDYADATGGWHDHLRDNDIPKRHLVLYSLLNCKYFWVVQGVWPNVSPEDLKPRSQLIDALANRTVSQSVQRTPDDLFELLISPHPQRDPTEQPLYRTDDSNVSIIEPLGQTAMLLFRGGEGWQPDGSLSGEARFNFSHNPLDITCAGCGTHPLHEPAHHDPSTQNDVGKGLLVSYESQLLDSAHHYSSVAQDGPDELSLSSDRPRVVCYCSEACRRRAERDPELLFDQAMDEPVYPDGTYLGELEIHQREETAVLS